MPRQDADTRTREVKTFNVPLPPDLYARLKITAERQRRSLKSQLLQTLDDCLDALDGREQEGHS